MGTTILASYRYNVGPARYALLAIRRDICKRLHPNAFSAPHTLGSYERKVTAVLQRGDPRQRTSVVAQVYQERRPRPLMVARDDLVLVPNEEREEGSDEPRFYALFAIDSTFAETLIGFGNTEREAVARLLREATLDTGQPYYVGD